MSASGPQSWRTVREAGDIQYAPVEMPAPPETPGWLERLSEWLAQWLEPFGRALGLGWPTFKVILIAGAIVLALWLAWRLLAPWIEQWRLRRRDDEGDEDWSPDRSAALALLSDADRLAGEGRYDEAVHLLLQRSVRQIEDARPEWIVPASTAREIARFEPLPAAARQAFAIIAAIVEKALYALHSLDAADWQAAREAYSDFALAKLRS